MAPCIHGEPFVISLYIVFMMSFDEAVGGLAFPAEIRRSLALLNLAFFDFDGKARQGQLVVQRGLADEVREIFGEIAAARFPIEKMLPVSVYGWSDDASMASNNSSAFNYRLAVGKTTLSRHSYGCAIDINPVQNPYIKGDLVLPPHARYDPTVPGTLVADGPVVEAFERRGWAWGGRWNTLRDWHHFEKPAP